MLSAFYFDRLVNKMTEINVSDLCTIAPQLHAGDRVLLSGTVYTARDAAHKRLFELLDPWLPSLTLALPSQEHMDKQ